MNIAWWLERAADEYGDRVALVDGRGGDMVTYRELRDRAAAIGTVLSEQFDVEADSVVTTLMADDCWHTALFYGVLRIGATFSAFNRSLHIDKFAADVARMSATVLVVSADFVEVGRELLERTGLRTLVVCDEVGQIDLPNLRRLAAGVGCVVPVSPCSNERVAAINFTGGTAGVSKGVIFPHGALTLSAQAALLFDRLVSSDVNLSCISLCHSGGVHDAVKWVMAGATNVLTGGWDAELAAKLIVKHRPSWIYFWVPTMVRDLLAHESASDLPWHGLKTILCGEPVPAELQQALIDRGVIAQNSYGMTEVMPVGILKSLVSQGEMPPVGSCGRPLIELCETVLKDPSTGQVITTADTPGEVCVRSGVTTPGYVNDPERTAAAFDDQGYLHTGDIASFDADGWWWLGGRTDDIINTGAEKLSLIEVEQVVAGHPAVQDVACVAVAHERFGQSPAAIVVLSRDERSDAEWAAALDVYCCQQIERWKRPRLYVFTDAVPRTIPKRTRDIRALRALVKGVVLRKDEKVLALEELCADSDAGSSWSAEG